MLTKIEGSTTTHRWPLNIEDPHEIEPGLWAIDQGNVKMTYSLGAPATGHCWVLKSLTWSFDVQPQWPALFWIDSLLGAYTWWITLLGQGPLIISTNQEPWKIKFEPCIKFPVDHDVDFTYIGGDPSVWYYFSCECWQEAESCNGT